jgi:hypothetical protein
LPLVPARFCNITRAMSLPAGVSAICFRETNKAGLDDRFKRHDAPPQRRASFRHG